MNASQRVLELLEEILESGGTPEEVCAGAPELLEEVRQRWERYTRVSAEIESAFPLTASPVDPDSAATAHGDAQLPAIPGYHVIQVLGRGGMGIVYLADHLQLRRKVALKMLLLGVFAGEKEIERHVCEARSIARIQHPNVVQVFDVGTHNNLPYFTMEVIGGGSLADRLALGRSGVMPAVQMVALLADAMEAAHELGIVHRDLKPSNILLTPAGVPKVSDFGIALHAEDAEVLTQASSRLGSPSYMAPEQVRGSGREIGPPADIYALGAILYEMLTGRPPFRGENPSDTERQVLAEQAIAPSRLNGQVPRDLETIVMRCLQKEPRRRYATARELAEDLRRFERCEPILARPIGRVERAYKWGRRHPTAVVAAAGGVVLTAFFTVLAVQRYSARVVALRSAVEDLGHVAGFQEKGNWQEARIALERAQLRLAESPSTASQKVLEERAGDMELATRLEKIRDDSMDQDAGISAGQAISAAYTDAFAQVHWFAGGEAVAASAARINRSPIRAVVIAALDRWTFMAPDAGLSLRLRTIAEAAEGDANGWRTQVANPQNYRDAEHVARLVETADIGRRSVSALLALADQMQARKIDNLAFLRAVQTAHPNDYWANLKLGDTLGRRNDMPEAARFYQAAIASRSGTANAYNNLGLALRAMERWEEAISQFRTAIAIAPMSKPLRNNLAFTYIYWGHDQEAITPLREAAALSPGNDVVGLYLALALIRGGKEAEGVDIYCAGPIRRTFDSDATSECRAAALRQGRLAEVWAGWRQGIAKNPSEAGAWDGYAEMCLYQGDRSEYERVRPILMERFLSLREPHELERVVRACLLSPPSTTELAALSEAMERVLATERPPNARTWGYPYFRFAEGLLKYRQRKFSEAIAILRGDAAPALGPAPALVAAMALYRLDQRDEARKTLDETVARYEWTPAKEITREHWIYRVLRNEAEALILRK